MAAVAVGDDRSGTDRSAARRQDDPKRAPDGPDLVRPPEMLSTDTPPTSQTKRPAALVDASALVALADRDDASHVAAVAAYRDLVASGYALFTTNAVVAETFDLLRVGLGGELARRWLRDCRLAVYHADDADEAEARRLALAAGEGRDLSLTEAICLAVMDRLGVTEAFAVDQRFLTEPAPDGVGATPERGTAVD